MMICPTPLIRVPGTDITSGMVSYFEGTSSEGLADVT
jgi:hypothetical protein